MSFTRACLGAPGSKAEVQVEANIRNANAVQQQTLSFHHPDICDTLGVANSERMIPHLEDQYLLQKPHKYILAMGVVIYNPFAPNL